MIEKPRQSKTVASDKATRTSKSSCKCNVNDEFLARSDVDHLLSLFVCFFIFSCRCSYADKQASVQSRSWLTARACITWKIECVTSFFSHDVKLGFVSDAGAVKNRFALNIKCPSEFPYWKSKTFFFFSILLMGYEEHNLSRSFFFLQFIFFFILIFV